VPSGKRNRLSIAHLLLWMATTGAVLALGHRNKPLPVDKNGIDNRQQQMVRQWNARYYVTLTFAPAAGAAYAGVVLACWRTATRQFGFPTQPGHWILLGMSGMFALAAVRPYLIWLIPEVADITISATASGFFIAISIALREPLRWRITFGMLGCAFGIALLAFVVKFLSPANELPPLLTSCSCYFRCFRWPRFFAAFGTSSSVIATMSSTGSALPRSSAST
jgi:hypothetical protein